MGDCDLVCVLEADDEAALAAFNLASVQLGTIRGRSLRAFTAAETDKIIAKMP
jgi:uncharacterized protein with GYD domain